MASGEEVKFAKIEARGWKVHPDAIGEGGFGAVHLCTHLASNKQRACKAMRLPTPLDREDFRHEVMVLKKCGKHHNICHIIDVAEDQRFGYLVMQSCTGGELFDRIAARNCTEKDSAMAVMDVLSALNFLHSKRIIHRDLKPENLLYKDKAPGSPLKLIDFGLAIHVAPNQRETEVCGTTSYMAPEVLKGSYSMEADIWSLGAIAPPPFSIFLHPFSIPSHPFGSLRGRHLEPRRVRACCCPRAAPRGARSLAPSGSSLPADAVPCGGKPMASGWQADGKRPSAALGSPQQRAPCRRRPSRSDLRPPDPISRLPIRSPASRSDLPPPDPISWAPPDRDRTLRIAPWASLARELAISLARARNLPRSSSQPPSREQASSATSCSAASCPSPAATTRRRRRAHDCS